MRRFIQSFLILIISLTPIFNIEDGLGVLGFSFSSAIIFAKILKDVCITFVAIAGLVYILFFKHPNSQILFIFSLFLLFTGIGVFFSSNLIIAAAGIRWCLPFFLIFILYDLVDYKFIERLTKVLYYLVLINILLQVYQMFNMPPIRGRVFGLAGRVGGFYALPSIAGIFGTLSFFMVRYYSNFKKNKKKIALLFCSLTVLLSMSSTGVGLLFFILIFPFYLKSRYKFFLGFLIFPLAFLTFLNLDTLTGRADGSSLSSFSTRIRILEEQVTSAGIISPNFGLATNTAVNLRTKLEISSDAFVADSLYTSVIGNYGWFFTIILLLILINVGFKIFSRRQIDIKMFFIICCLASSSLILTEIFPVNLIMTVLASWYLSRNKKTNVIMT